MREGKSIDSKRKFTGSATMLRLGHFRSRTYQKGYWFRVTERYLELKFQIKGKMHYGWARFKVNSGMKILAG